MTTKYTQVQPMVSCNMILPIMNTTNLKKIQNYKQILINKKLFKKILNKLNTVGNSL